MTTTHLSPDAGTSQRSSSTGRFVSKYGTTTKLLLERGTVGTNRREKQKKPRVSLQVWTYLRDNPRSTRVQVARDTGLSNMSVVGALRMLVRNGFAYYEGKTKGCRWFASQIEPPERRGRMTRRELEEHEPAPDLKWEQTALERCWPMP